ncbi:telomere-associated protein RIF1 isoform X2 [Scleropages formosus]|uniref:telomere-associated protein RIF1 isoform X2 n=1 Tax=Scleropages formosus TaxID=113540 RepID=UPI0008791FA3|nr:telomere-associated protein RIF1 isoform X2 [Scleropages formosus]
MMATVLPASSSLVPLLESLEDPEAGQAEKTDAYLTITNRLSGEDGRNFLPAVVKHFSRLGQVLQTHISSQNVELSQAALQALGFCAFHSNVVSGIPDDLAEELLVSLSSLVLGSTEKNTCARALWVISKQNFPSEVVSRKVPDILKTLEAVQTREDIQSVIMEHEALNVVIRLLEQAPTEMGEGAVQWAKLVIPLVVHSASKVRLRAAAALEMGMPLLLEKQQEVAAIIEPLMSSKLIPELQKLFSSKNETNVLKLWPLFVRLLGKLLHRGGPFINSLLHLEELGFRSSSPVIKKIAFIAWKSLIDNFALNPDILCSAKRLKLLMQPLSSVQVRAEALQLTKLEVWWYLVIKLGPNLAANFEQVGVPLLQSAVSTESKILSPTPTRNSSSNVGVVPSTPKTGGPALNSSIATPRMNLNSSVHGVQTFPSIQLLGLEMLLHYFLGPEVTAVAAKHKLQLSLEPLSHPLLASHTHFTKFSGVLVSAVRDGVIGIGKDAPDSLLSLIWKNLVGLVNTAIESGNKKDRQGSEMLTLLLQALQSIVSSESLPALRTLGLLETTVKGIPQKILGSAAYQVANMDILNGTPALFLTLQLFHSSMLHSFVQDERFFVCLETLVSCGLSGPTSPLAFSESVLGVIGRSAELVENKEHLWRMWSIVVSPLTDTIIQTNEVNQGDALEHNFTAVYSALMFPVNHLLTGQALPCATQKSLLSTWSRLYKAFARCSALVATAEENICCEELCAKMLTVMDRKALSNVSTLDAVASILLVIIECIDFSPYTVKSQQKPKSPRTPSNWVKKKNKVLGNLAAFQTLLVQLLESFLAQEAHMEGTGPSMGGLASVLLAILSVLFSSLALATAVCEMLSTLSPLLATLYEQAGRPQNERPYFYSSVAPKLEKLLGDILTCLQTRCVLAYDSELLGLLAPLLCVLLLHKSKGVRSLITQFWNATFANAPVLTYPEELKAILNQVKQQTPMILPGFHAVDVSDDFSGQYSGECSQLETKISGVTVKSTGKRGSLLAKAVDRKEKASLKPISVKLDFGSPKPPRREVLEEEASVDFVFIPPETKERVLTEHQKEVKRTKRVDIPAMYNNLDASLDTTIFSQYSQSQEESMDKLLADEKTEKTTKEDLNVKVSEEKMDVEESIQAEKMDVEQPPQADIKELSEADISSKMDTSEQEVQAVEVSASDSIQDILATETAEISTDGCNVSASSDVISGTPQKPGSRRQSFITLEKYEDRKTASMGSVTKFTGPLSKPSKGQEATESVAEGEMEETSQGVDRPKRGRPKKQSRSSQQEVIVAVEVEKEAEKEAECKVNNGNDSYSQATDDPDIIPGTQIDSTGKARLPSTETKGNASSEEMKEQLVDSQGSEISSQTEVRRSGRRRSRPLRPGEDREETEDKNKMGRVNVEQGSCQTDSQKILAAVQMESLSQGRQTRRSKVLEAESENRDDMNSKTPPGGSKMNNNSQKASFASNMEVPSQVRPGRKSKVAEPVKDEAKEASQESSQVQGRYKTRRSSQNLLSAIEHSESDGSETREDTQPVKKRGRKPKLLNSDVIVSPKNTQCQQSTHVESVEIGISEASQKEEPKSINSDSGSLEAPQTVSEEVERNSSDPETSISASDSKPATIRSGSTVDEFPTESQPVVPQCTTALTEIVTKSQKVHICPHSNRGRGRRRSRGCHCKVSGSLSQESDVSDSQSNEDQGENRSSQDGNLLSDPSESVCSESKESQIQACTKDAVFVEIDPQVMASVSNNALALGTAETEGKSNISDKDEVEIQNTSQLVDMPCEKIEGAVEDICNDQPEGEEKHENNQEDQCQIIDGLDADAPLQQEDLVAQDEEAHLNSADVAVAFAPAAAASPTMPAELSEPSKPLCMDSPPKQKALEGEADVPDVDQSPSSGKTRGVWSPSASPSTSILKKGQKRPLEEESPSPLLKSRRVSFADPIHHQELADDIDRRSPVIRSSAGSSPKSKNINNVSFQQRFITTPTKGTLTKGTLSPRNLHSPRYKSPKKCLISEMSQEPKPIPKDCVYPALVGCCVPVEAVLPQLSSVWPRGFGHLVRARNIKTVGNLSALTPAEVKSLPIRSPKLSNVKKALKTYHEQQRKGRGDELKGFDETEKMTSEPEERDPPECQEDERLTDAIDAEQVNIPVATDPASEVEAMAVRLTAEELSRCSPGQLVQMHEQLSTLMRNIVVQLQSRLPSTVTENTP